MKTFLLAIMLCLYHCDLLAEEQVLLQVRTIAIPPYGIESKEQMSGVYFDISNQLLKIAGLSGEHYIYPYSRIIHELKLGKTDLTIMFKYRELAPFVEYIFPLPALKNVVIGRKGEVFKSVKSLHGKTIAYLRGAKFSDDIDNNLAIKKQTVVDFDQGLLMLSKGRVDAIIGPIEPIHSAAKNLNIPISFFNNPLVVSERVPWLQVSKKSLHKIPVEQIRDVFSTMIKQGELARIKSKYL